MVVSILPHAEFGRNDHRKDAPTVVQGYCKQSDAITVKSVFVSIAYNSGD